MKRIATIGALSIALTTCAVPANSTPTLIKPSSPEIKTTVFTVQSIAILPAKQATMLEAAYQTNLAKKAAEIEHQTALLKNQQAIDMTLAKLRKYIGKTSYVFSGSTPRGWDCSGLVVWFYREIGIEVPHSATKQGLMKPKTKDPKPGDIVVTKYKNSKNFIHSGIYIGDNKMIHSGFKKGQRTEIINLDDASFDGQKHYFVRMLKLPNE